MLSIIAISKPALSLQGKKMKDMRVKRTSEGKNGGKRKTRDARIENSSRLQTEPELGQNQNEQTEPTVLLELEPQSRKSQVGKEFYLRYDNLHKRRDNNNKNQKSRKYFLRNRNI